MLLVKIKDSTEASELQSLKNCHILLEQNQTKLEKQREKGKQAGAFALFLQHPPFIFWKPKL